MDQSQCRSGTCTYSREEAPYNREKRGHPFGMLSGSSFGPS